jgi:hypothetical protein
MPNNGEMLVLRSQRHGLAPRDVHLMIACERQNGNIFGVINSFLAEHEHAYLEVFGSVMVHVALLLEKDITQVYNSRIFTQSLPRHRVGGGDSRSILLLYHRFTTYTYIPRVIERAPSSLQ